MPLIVLIGHPCSGKTTISNLIYNQLTNNQCNVTLLNYENLTTTLTRDYMYESNSSVHEKNSFGTIRSHIERLLTKQHHVICDFNIFIKSLRYELFTRAKMIQTQYCVVYVNAEHDICKQRNTICKHYSEQSFSDIYGRMEYPNSSKRWDQPLYTIDNNIQYNGGNHSNNIFNEQITTICNYVQHGTAHKESLATLPQQLASSDYITLCDTTTNNIIQHIYNTMNSQTYVIGDNIHINSSSNNVNNNNNNNNTTQQQSYKIQCNHKLSLPELKRIQRTFLKMIGNSNNMCKQQIEQLFVEFINKSV